MNRTTVGNLPFFSLSDAEFNAVICNWRYDFDTDLDLFNILPNPDKSDDKDPDNMLNCPNSNLVVNPPLFLN